MAIYRLDIRPVARSAGRTATAAAAYRAGERLRDERTRRWFDHSTRPDVLHKEILLPSRFGAGELAWARQRASLWNAAEHAERQRNSRVAREYQVALPHELEAAARVELARTFARHVADRYQVAVDLAIHAPRPGGDPRNVHAHLLTTTRVLTPDGLGGKTGLDMHSVTRRSLGLQGGIRELRAVREHWAALTNEALAAANLAVRVDHRSLLAQGIDREPRARLPWAAYLAERRGLRSEVAERVRAGYRLKLQARRERYAAERDAAERGQGRTASQDRDAIGRRAREDWLRHRDAPRVQRPGRARERAVTAERTRGRPEYDYDR